MHRAQQKRQIQIDRDALYLGKPVSVQNLSLDDKTILVSNQIYQNQPGYEVITVSQLHSSDQIVLVSRGWISVEYDSK